MDTLDSSEHWIHVGYMNVEFCSEQPDSSSHAQIYDAADDFDNQQYARPIDST